MVHEYRHHALSLLSGGSDPLKYARDPDPFERDARAYEDKYVHQPRVNGVLGGNRDYCPY